MSVSLERTSAQVVGIGADGTGNQGAAQLRKKLPASYKTYREMRKDPTIALARWLASAPIIASQWTVESNAKAPEGAKQFIEDHMQPLRLHLLQTVAYNLIDFGWSSFEKVLDFVPDGKLAPKKLKPLLPDITWILIDADNGSFAGLENDSGIGDPVQLSAEESLLFTNEPEGTDWYGTPIMENVRKTYLKWQEVDTAASKYDEKIAGTHLIVKYPIGVSPYNGVETDNLTIANAILGAWKATGALAMPSSAEASQDGQWHVEYLSDAGQGGQAFVSRQEYLDRLKVRGFGLPERAVLESEYGTKADAEAHADFAILNLELRHSMIVQTVNWHLVNHLIRLNWGKQFENSVWLRPTPITDTRKKFLQTVYTALLQSPDGQLLEGDKLDMHALRLELGLPQVAGVDENEDVIGQPALADPANPTPATSLPTVTPPPATTAVVE